MERQRRSRLSPSVRIALCEGAARLADLATVAAAGLAAAWLRFAEPSDFDSNAPTFVVGLLVALQVFTFCGSYRPVDLGRWCGIQRMISLWIIVILSVLAYLFVTKTSDDVSRLWLGYWACIAGAGIVGIRLIARILLTAFAGGSVLQHRVLIIAESEELANGVARQQQEDNNAIVAGTLVLSDGILAPTAPRINVQIQDLIHGHDADRVVLAAGWTQANFIESILATLRHCPVEVLWVPSLASVRLPLIDVVRSGNGTALRMLEPPIDGWRYVIKSVQDRLLAALLLILLSSLMLLIAAAVKLTSPGPIFFRQQRYGFNREIIEVLKFRTMHAFACDARDSTAVKQATRGDPRVTAVGRLLRRSSLDELPQLFNVLRGEMSLVGPRPHAVPHDTYYETRIGDYLQRHCVKPGITGLAQVNGCRGAVRTVEDMKQRVILDLEYMKDWTPSRDLWILFRTFVVVVGGKNAY
jgi:putative colanic acid biosynthesis UDP-glucose lipid carrier transferase